MKPGSSDSAAAGMLERDVAAKLALEADLVDPDSLHLLSSRRTALLPR